MKARIPAFPLRALALPVLALAAGLACSDRGDPVSPVGGDPDPLPTVSYSGDIQPIWNGNCAPCHGENGGLSLSEAGSRANLVGVVSAGYAPALRVAAGDPESSVLYRKLIGDEEFGDRMPQGGALTEAEIAVVRAWIEEGARDN
ncbi:MAG: cytochrome c [Candidatus Latescibacterota bacterium]|nr:MAG: cytochrome c [Candidatus Latescibacterota bacterium]